MSYIVFLTTGFYTYDGAFCKIIAISLHFSLLSTFTWMLVGAFHMYQALIRVLPRYFQHFILKASALGYGLPLLIVIITVGVNTENYGPVNGICWLRPTPFYASFVSVVGLTVIINIVVFILVVIQLHRMAKRQEEIQANARKNYWGKFRALVSIFTLLGLTWIFGFIYVGEAGSIVIQYFFVICVTSQGLLIFFLYGLFKKEARDKFLPCFLQQRLTGSSGKQNTKSSQSTATKWYSKDRKISYDTTQSRIEVRDDEGDNSVLKNYVNEETG
jgi:hypothetical protein